MNIYGLVVLGKTILPNPYCQPNHSPHPNHLTGGLFFPGRLISKYSNPAETSFQMMEDNHKPKSLTK